MSGEDITPQTSSTHYKVIISSMLVAIVILAAFAVYDDQKMGMLNGELSSLNQSVSSMSKTQSPTGLVHSTTIVSGYLFPRDGFSNYGVRIRIVSFIANESGLLVVQDIALMSGNITIGDGPTMVTHPFPVIGNLSVSNYALTPVIPGNVTVYFEWTLADYYAGAAVLTPFSSGNYTVTYYW